MGTSIGASSSRWGDRSSTATWPRPSTRLLAEVRDDPRVGLGCASGSPDLGFLVTPGRLLAVCSEAAEGVSRGTPDVWIDYRFRYLDRYPALFVRAAGGQIASVFVPQLQRLAQGAERRIVLWSHVDQALTISLNGVAVNLAPAAGGGPTLVAVDVPVANLDGAHIELPAGGEVWLYLLEQDEVAAGEPVFWVAPGTYHVDGLIADARGGGSFPAMGSRRMPASGGAAARRPIRRCPAS